MSRAASVALRMLPDSTRISGTVVRFSPARSSLNTMPPVPSYVLGGMPATVSIWRSTILPNRSEAAMMRLLMPSATGSRMATPRPPGGPPSA